MSSKDYPVLRHDTTPAIRKYSSSGSNSQTLPFDALTPTSNFGGDHCRVDCILCRDSCTCPGTRKLVPRFIRKAVTHALFNEGAGNERHRHAPSMLMPKLTCAVTAAISTSRFIVSQPQGGACWALGLDREARRQGFRGRVARVACPG